MSFPSLRRWILIVLAVTGAVAISAGATLSVQSMSTLLSSPRDQGGTGASEITSRSWSPLTFLSLLPSAPSPSPRRPIAVVIDNHEDARGGQRGLQSFETVFEVLVEGQISRLVGLGRIAHLGEAIGAVRSLRPDMLDLLEPSTLVIHAGGSAEAYTELQARRLLHLDGVRHDGDLFHRDPSRPAPHNLYIDRSDLLNALESLPDDSPPWTPLCPEGDLDAPGVVATQITLSFLSPRHDASFTFDAEEGAYRRSAWGAVRQAAPSTILVLEVPLQGIGEQGHLEMPLRGAGRLLLFRDGTIVEGQWERSAEQPLTLSLRGGVPCHRSPGQLWVTLLPTLERVTWEGDNSSTSSFHP